MQFEEFETSWPHIQQQAAEHWRRLTRIDIQSVQGKTEYLVESVAERYGKPQAEAEKEVYDWILRQQAAFKKRA